eukprot:578012-Pleurochrysis_carterae.AAC.3
MKETKIDSPEPAVPSRYCQSLQLNCPIFVSVGSRQCDLTQISLSPRTEIAEMHARLSLTRRQRDAAAASVNRVGAGSIGARRLKA